MGEVAGIEGATQQVTDTPAPVVEGTQGPADDSGGINPAWKELLDQLPSQLHPTVQPLLAKWDKGVQDRFAQVHSQFDPYKPIVDSGYRPEQVQQAIQLAQMIEKDPRKIWESLGEMHQFAVTGTEQTPEQGQDDEVPPEVWQHPEFQRLKQLAEGTASVIQKEAEARQQAEQDRALEQSLVTAKEKYGDFTQYGQIAEQAIIAGMMGGKDADTAVKEFMEFANSIGARNAPPSSPTILTPGGGLPTPPDVTSLDDAGRKNLVVQMLAAAAQNSG